jgi:ATP-dependent DNA helicase DinG
MMGKLANSFNETSVKTMAERFPKFNETYKETINAFDDLFTLIHQYVRKKLLTPKSEIGRLSFRYDVTKERSSNWAAILETADLSVSKLADVLKLLRKIENHLQESESYLDVKQKGRLVDFSSLINTLETIEQSIRTLLLTHDENMVCWMEIDAKGARNATYLYAKPIDISELLADQFFAKKRSVILTSATLTISGKSFKYIVNRLGLEDFGPETHVIESPFSFETKAKLLIPSDIPNIKEVKLEDYIPILSRSLHKIAQKTKGRMLVLFTSYDMLRNTYIDLKTRLENEEFTLIAQGVSSGSRAKLTKNFKQNDQAILFGTSSFWEGVDIPGEDLSCIVIVRLPFSPPDNPVIAARSEKIKADGGNPFFDLSLPQAIIRFKQGFGRLIRTSSDKGAVFVFDTRIVTTRYGKNFIRSLPSVPTIEGPLDDLLLNLQDWL